VNQSKVERMTGLKLGNVRLENGLRNYYLYTPDTLETKYEHEGSNESVACQRLYDMHWSDVKKFVIHQAGYKCQECSFRGGLDVHHKVHRSQGSTNWDTDNLVALCRACHQTHHGLRVAR
jgi:5-methylcytosine-specific restriction endonuclease McrA